MLTLEKNLYAYIRNHTDCRVVKFDNGIGHPRYYIIPKDADKKSFNYDRAICYTISTLMDCVEDMKLKNKEKNSDN